MLKSTEIICAVLVTVFFSFILGYSLVAQEYMMSIKQIILYGVWLGLGLALIDIYVGGIV